MNSTLHIIGSGIAGLTTALALSSRFRKIILYEKDKSPCNFSSRKNAAIARSYEHDPLLSMLAKRSLMLYFEREKKCGPLVEKTGLLVEPLERDYYDADFLIKHPGYEGLTSVDKTLEFNGCVLSGSYVKDNGYFYLDRVLSDFLQQVEKTGADVQTECRVQDFALENGLVKSFIVKRKHSEEMIQVEPGDLVVNAAGSWAHSLQSSTSSTLSALIPHKRHIYRISGTPGNAQIPVIWSERNDIYLRRDENNDLVITHCDERPASFDDYSVNPGEKANFLQALKNRFSDLHERPILEERACLRTFSLDDLPVLGFDPRVKNLFYVAGLGGRGLSIAMALVEEIRKAYDTPESKSAFAAGRFY